MENEARRLALATHHLEVLPGHARAPAGPERLHGRLLGREPRRIAREAGPPPRLAVRLLGDGEDARPEAGAGGGLEGAADTPDVADIDADRHDHRITGSPRSRRDQHAPQV